MKPKTRIRDILFPEGGKARKKLRKINRFLHGKKINDPEEHIRNAYDEWMELNDPTEEELEKQRKTKFKISPKISILVPMYNTPLNFFEELVEYMINQTYTNWELCLEDGSPKKNEEIE